MMTPQNIMIALFVMIIAYFLLVAAHRGARVTRLLQQVVQAMEARRFDEALGFYDRADRIWNKFKSNPANRSVTFAIEQGLGMCFLALNRFSEAERHLRRAIDLLNQGVEQEHRVAVCLYCDFAMSLLAQGKDAEGEAALTKVEQLCNASSVNQVDGVAELLVGYAQAASSINQRRCALRLAHQAIALLSDTPSWHQGNWASTQIALASIHMAGGEYQQARQLTEHAITPVDGEQLDEADHDNALFYLAELDVIAGELRRAIGVLNQCSRYREEEYGDSDHRTTLVVAALAFANRCFGDYRQAESLCRAALQSQAEQLSAEDPILIGTKLQAALLLLDLAQYREAEALIESLEAVPLTVMKSASNSLAFVRLLRGIWHLDHFQFDRACQFLQESLHLAQEMYGTSHNMTAEYRHLLGLALLRAERPNDAEPLLMEALAICEAAADASRISFAELLVSIAELYLATNRAQEAQAAVNRAETMMTGRLLPTSLILGRLNSVMAEVLARQGNCLEAMKRIEQAETAFWEIQCLDHPRRVHHCEAAIAVYRAGGDRSTEERYREQRDKIRSRFADSDVSADSPLRAVRPAEETS